MSYLLGPRLHFAGRFTADISTVNNVATHFKNPNQPPAPGFSPNGSGSWLVNGCTVTSAVFADGTVASTPADDPVLGAGLAQVGRARLVDLDTEQQLVSQIWALGLRLVPAGGGGTPAFAGAFKVTAFSDLWFSRALASGGGDLAASAFYQSVLAGVTWDDLFGSRLLTELKQASASGILSIKFNLDGYDTTQRVGRIVGTIGAAQASEPEHFIMGRQCMPASNGPVWFFPAIVDQNRGKLIADFGNALQTKTSGGPFDPALDLQIGLVSGGQFSSFGRIPIGPEGWYEQTAGICEFPADRSLSAAELSQLGSTPIGVVQQIGATRSLVAMEGVDGLHVRAEDFVYRMSANDTATFTLRASRFGRPLPNAAISLTFDSSGLQQQGSGNLTVGTPATGLSFPPNVTTDAQGIASVSLTAGTLGKPRDYIDGQVYGMRYTLAQSDPNNGGYFDPADFISVLVWTDYRIPSDPNWTDDVQPILKQYEQLYPVMKSVGVTLGNYASVVAHKDQMRDVFMRPQEDAHYMPVTRDLSAAKRQMMLNWLQTTGNAGQPNLGPKPAVVAMAPIAALEAGAEGDLVARIGGKSAAMRKRVGGPQQRAGFMKRTI